jgi:tyrosine-protein kinase Etk/Wzc
MMVIFFVMGTVVGLGLNGLRRMLRRGIEDHRLIESKLGLPVIVTIPHSDNQEVHDLAMRKRPEGLHLLATLNPEDQAIESLRSVRTRLHMSMEKMSSRVLMMTGPSPDIGKSFVACNLAVVMAQAGAKVLLVDGDLRRGTLHKYFGLKNRLGGLAEVISGQSPWKTLVRPNSLDQGNGMNDLPGLNLITTGILPTNPSELLMSNHFSNFLAEVAAAYDYVIIDAPPLLSVTDAEIIASKVNSVLLVVKYGRHPLDEIRTCQRRLKSQGIPLAGCIFNDVEMLGMGYHDYRYAYHYTYKPPK